MKALQQHLKAVHDELTCLMAESRMDSLSRQKLAAAANDLLEISQQIEQAVAEQTQKNGTNPSASDVERHRSRIQRAMSFLALVPALVDYVMKRWKNDDP